MILMTSSTTTMIRSTPTAPYAACSIAMAMAVGHAADDTEAFEQKRKQSDVEETSGIRAHIAADKLEIETIKGQLEAAKWPTFDDTHGLAAAQSRYCILPNEDSCPSLGAPIGSKCECADENGKSQIGRAR
jgi:hypothetical protein